LECKEDLGPDNYLKLTAEAGEIPKSMKKFALSLQLKSPKAYNYVRNEFHGALPAESTKGIGVENKIVLQDLVSQLLSTFQKTAKDQNAQGGHLLCSLTPDEMAIKKLVNFGGKIYAL